MDPPHSGAPNGSKEDKWTVVPRSKRPRPATTPKPPGTDKDMSLDKLMASYKQKMQTWKASTCRQEVRQILDRKQPDGGWQVRNAICFASGSFSRNNWECQRRSMIQFAAFVDIVNYLRSTSDDEIVVSAQEPEYTPLDEEFLAKLNVHVYDATGTDQVSSPGQGSKADLGLDTFVFEAFMSKTLSAFRPVLTSNARLFVRTSSARAEVEAPSEEHRELAVLYEGFDAKYSSYYFPTYEEEPNVFEGLRISWKELDD